MPQKLRNVDPHKIKIPEVRVTARMDEETTQQFENSVKETGIDEPIKVYQVDGDLILSDGLHRLMQAIKLGLETVPVYVREGTMEDVLCNNLMSGHLRGKHPVSEMIRAIAALSKEYQYDSEKIAAKTGLTRDYVEKLQLISELTPMCLAALDEGAIKVGHAFAITKLKDPVKQEVVLQQVILYHLKVKDTEDIISSALQQVTQKAGEPVAEEHPRYSPVKCFYCGEEHMPQELANPNTCMTCSSNMMQSIALARMELQKDKNSKEDSAKT
jgi:ParB/RepB/Spo0J family partition protein